MPRGLTDIERRSLIFGEHEIGADLITSVMERTVLPEVELTYETAPGVDGARVTDARLLPLEIPVRVRLDNDEARRTVGFLRRLASRLRPGVSTTPQRLVLPDDPARYHLALVTGATRVDGHDGYPEAEITFFCPDPVAWGQTRHATVTTAGNKLMTGGTWEASPVLRCRPSEGEGPWTVENVTSGAYVSVAGPFDGLGELVVDMAAETAKFDGTERAVDLGSDYFSVFNGDVLRVSEGSARADWTERWL